MLIAQVIVNGLVLGGLYACIAAGFSLVWGVLNVINILHGSLIILGAYAAFFAYQTAGVHPYLAMPLIGLALFGFGYAIQRIFLNRAIGAPVLITLTLTFGLNLMVDNAMLLAFSADFRKLQLKEPLGVIDLTDYVDWLDIVVPIDRLVSMSFAILLVLGLYGLLKRTNLGRAIVAVRMDARAASLMGIDVRQIFAVTFGLGAAMAGAAGALLALIFPISPLTSPAFLGKAFVICVLGGLGSVPGVLLGGLALGIIESFGALLLGAEYSLTVAFSLLILLLIFRPTGLVGKKAFQ
ncbi:MAG: branched-chain amino acid ABC transporter permease [Alphaproteobacteria bacterium]|nr:branched-chain amino acid ABC transporter permease [Alphaproteobacteria bacterium]